MRKTKHQTNVKLRNTCAQTVAPVVKKFTERIRTPGSSCLLAIDGVKRLIYEKTQTAAKRNPPRHLEKEKKSCLTLQVLKTFLK
jgi:hypothetical protein